jgi:polysaccharide export outer membrane protein
MRVREGWVRIARESSAVRCTAIAGLLAIGCFGRELSLPPPDPTPMDRASYTIGVTDVLKITVWKNPESSVEAVPVRTDGKISVPLINDVQAEGLTPEELKDVITRDLSEFVSEPQVTVVVVQMNSRFVSVIGEVGGQDTRVPLTRDLRVLEAIAQAGGFGPFADKSDIRIVRRNADGTESEYRFDYGAYIRGRAPGTNIVLQHGDTIVVPD